MDWAKVVFAFDAALPFKAYDAPDVRRECYLAMRRHFVPFLFTESPFYFEADVKASAEVGNDLISTIIMKGTNN